jgi:hypothetical protein
MALIIRGKTTCPLCGQIIHADDEIVSFPPFVGEPGDPLHLFSDAGFHKYCFERHPLAGQVIERLKAIPTWPVGGPECAVCGRQISLPDEHFGLYRLTDDPASPLYRFNDLHMHRACLKNFNGLAVVLAAEGLSAPLMQNLAELRELVGGMDAR